MLVPEAFDIELQIRSKPCYLCVVRAAVCTAMEKFGFCESSCGQIMLAVDEAISNVIRHAYDGDESGRIWVKMKALESDEETGILFCVEDEGKQVDPTEICGRPLDRIEPGGLGVHIIREVMDQVEYTKRPKAGMRLVMLKHLTPTHTPTTECSERTGT